MKRMASVLLMLAVAGVANATSVRPEITAFQSKERITHLAPGGANAARELDITVQLFDDAGRAVRMPGLSIDLTVNDVDKVQSTVVGRLAGITGVDGAFSGRITFSDCRSSDIKGPIRVHRISNRPEYWDTTYADAAIYAGTTRLARFVHVCKEVYRGNRP
ncbi:MAG: hypothetical protein WBW32_08635 [Luteibacter sp.]